MNTLKVRRQLKNLMQYELAALVPGVSQTQISRIERYNDPPAPRMAQVLAAFFGVKVDVLFPDGVSQYKNVGRHSDVYVPPDEAVPVVHLPSRCPKCGAQVVGEWCYACAYDFEARAEAANA
jgi:transcriptional regulator with XRE-family HTH domain